jgi:hypothetical protein
MHVATSRQRFQEAGAVNWEKLGAGQVKIVPFQRSSVIVRRGLLRFFIAIA